MNLEPVTQHAPNFDDLKRNAAWLRQYVPPHPLKWFSQLNWIDGRPLMNVLEPYRQRVFTDVFDAFENGRPKYNLVLMGRAKKNWKSSDLILAALYKLAAYISPKGNQCYILANDQEQAGDDLEIAKKIIIQSPSLADMLTVHKNVIRRNDGKGFLEILPAKDVVGAHGKTYCFCGFDEIHGYKNWDILEAMQFDPSRPDALQWLTSYASIYHRPGVPLFDMMATGKKGADPRMYFSWYAADYCTDPEFEHLEPVLRANPSAASWEDQDYLVQQQRRLPAHKYRRLHLNLPGLPEGAAYSAEKIMDAVDRGVTSRPYDPTCKYVAFIDMSGGSNDDSTLCIAHKNYENKAIVDVLINQGPPPPFDPDDAVTRFARVLKEYRLKDVIGDNYAGTTFINRFGKLGINYAVAELTKHEFYDDFEPHLNSNRVVMLDEPIAESQFLGLIWRGSGMSKKIDHPPNEHDDWSNAVAGAVVTLFGPQLGKDDFQLIGRQRLDRRTMWDDMPAGDTRRDRAWNSGNGGRGKWDW